MYIEVVIGDCILNLDPEVRINYTTMGNECSQASAKLPLSCDDYVEMAKHFIQAQIRTLKALKTYPRSPSAVVSLGESYSSVADVLHDRNWEFVEVILTAMEEDVDMISVFDEQDVVSRVLAASIRRGYNSFRQNFMDIFKKTCREKREKEYLHPECSFCQHTKEYFSVPIVRPTPPKFYPDDTDEERSRAMKQYREDCRLYHERQRDKREWESKLLSREGYIPVIDRDQHPMASTSIEDYYMTRAEDTARQTMLDAKVKNPPVFNTTVSEGPTSVQPQKQLLKPDSDSDSSIASPEEHYDPRDYDIRVDSAGNVSY